VLTGAGRRPTALDPLADLDLRVVKSVSGGVRGDGRVLGGTLVDAAIGGAEEVGGVIQGSSLVRVL
jgi:hypothetical protein